MRMKAFVFGALVGIVLAGAAQAGEEGIRRSELPAAVEKTVAAQRADATRGFSREVEGGRTVYEAELTVNGRRKDILIDSAGTILEVEEEVDLASLPSAVQAGLRSAAGRGQLVQVESITRHGRVVAYEAQVENGGKKSEIQVDPNGKRLGRAK